MIRSFNLKRSIPVKRTFTAGTLFFATLFFATLFAACLSAFSFVPSNIVCGATYKIADDESENHRSIGDYRRDLKKFMKLSKNDDEQLQRNAIFNLCALHHELVMDPRFQTSEQIKSFRVVVAKRLEGFAKEFKKSKLVEARKSKKRNRSMSAGKDTQTGQPNSDQSRSDNEAEASEESEEEAEYEAMYQSASQTYQDLGQISGGPNQLFNYAGGQFGSPWDHGDQLVALIQNTVDPDKWRDAGGNASIHYFRPLRVLVINASWETHDKTERLLWMLRASQ